MTRPEQDPTLVCDTLPNLADQSRAHVNNIATYLEQSDADTWIQALDDMSAGKPSIKKRRDTFYVKHS